MHMPMIRSLIALLLTAAAAQAAEVGDAIQGRRMAQDACAQCHAVNPGQDYSFNEKAPAFQALADTSGVTSALLMASLQTSHRTMPNLIVKDQEAADVIAYILSLRKRERR